MKAEEFEDWKRSARPKAIEKRSKIIIRMDKLLVLESDIDQDSKSQDQSQINASPA